jgi:hypothetical protein
MTKVITRVLIHTLPNGTAIHVEVGTKSRHDFRVRFIGPYGRPRTPKHIHLIVEMYVKQAHNPALTMRLRKHLLRLYDQVRPVKRFPPRLRFYRAAHAKRFSSLNAVGEFTVDSFLIINELIFIQEKTNYPRGSLTRALYEAFGVNDRFSVIARATWRGGT